MLVSLGPFLRRGLCLSDRGLKAELLMVASSYVRYSRRQPREATRRSSRAAGARNLCQVCNRHVSAHAKMLRHGCSGFNEPSWWSGSNVRPMHLSAPCKYSRFMSSHDRVSQMEETLCRRELGKAKCPGKQSAHHRMDSAESAVMSVAAVEFMR